jgi:hypothetical protein
MFDTGTSAIRVFPDSGFLADCFRPDDFGMRDVEGHHTVAGALLGDLGERCEWLAQFKIS